MIVKHRLVCCLHGILCVILGLHWCINHWDWTCGKENSVLEVIIGANTSGHLAADFIFMLLNGFLDVGNLIHHIVVGTAYSIPCWSAVNGNLLGFMILPGEASNVQMNLREVIRKIGWRFTKTYYHIEFQYLALYIIARAIVTPIISLKLFTCPHYSTLLCVIFVAHNL
jgi:hypothetical protein